MIDDTTKDQAARDREQAARAANEPKRAPQSGEKGFDPKSRPGYMEYPKLVTGPSGVQVRVNSKEEEDRALKGDPVTDAALHPNQAVNPNPVTPAMPVAHPINPPPDEAPPKRSR